MKLARCVLMPIRVAMAFIILLAPTPRIFIAEVPKETAQAAGPNQYSLPEWFPLRASANGAEIRIGCTYHSPNGPYFNCNGWHPVWALDLGAATGTAVYAAGAGFATRYSTTGDYGRSVVVNHGTFGKTIYAHLSQFKIPSAGAWVDQNSIIGLVGTTGATSTTFPHLHFERFNGTPWVGAVDPGQLKSCHGSTLVKYPELLGLSTWEGIPWGVYYAHSDGTVCAPPVETGYHSAFVAQNSYPVLRRNECYRFEIQFRNIGTQRWTPNVVRLGTDRPQDRIPSFVRDDLCTYQPSGWVAPNRVRLVESSVFPNAIGNFRFWYTIPSTHQWGKFQEYFRPVAEYITWMEDCGCYWDVNVIECPECSNGSHFAVWRSVPSVVNKAVWWAADSFLAKYSTIQQIWFIAAWSGQAEVKLYSCEAMDGSCFITSKVVSVIPYGDSLAQWDPPIPVNIGQRYWVQFATIPHVQTNPILAHLDPGNSFKAADVPTVPGQTAVDASCAIWQGINDASRTKDCSHDLLLRVEAPD